MNHKKEETMEEDIKLRKLFGDFQPKLSDDDRFMQNLKRKMEEIEWVRQQQLLMKRRHRIALCVAAMVGVVLGVVGSLAYPYMLTAFTAGLNSVHLTWGKIMGRIMPEPSVFLWIVFASLSMIIVKNAYDLALSLMKSQKTSKKSFAF